MNRNLLYNAAGPLLFRLHPKKGLTIWFFSPTYQAFQIREGMVCD